MNRGLLCIGIGISLVFFTGCGKVTQEAVKDSEAHSFKLVFNIADIFVPPQEASQQVSVPTYAIVVEDPIYGVVKGYKERKIDQLAWGKGLVTISKKRIPAVTTPNKKEAYDIYEYVSKAFDKKNIEIKQSAKKSQIKATYMQTKTKWEFDTIKIPKDYDFYMIASFTSVATYRLAVINQNQVSSNVRVTIDDISLFDTFQALLFIKAYETMEMKNDNFALLRQLFDISFFQARGLAFPVLNKEEFNVKKPVWTLEDRYFKEYAEILDIANIDSQEAKEYVEANNRQLLNTEQKNILINRLNQRLTQDEP